MDAPRLKGRNMRRKELTITGLVVILLLVVGCTGYTETAQPLPSVPLPEEKLVEAKEAGKGSGQETQTILSDHKPPVGMTWISPGKVNIGKYYPGGKAQYPITIHNSKDTTASFAVTYRFPDHTATGYDKPPEGAQAWVIIADLTPVLAPKETREVMVTLAVPNEVVIGSDKWEFWISVVDTTRQIMVVTELASIWLVDMRK